MGFFEEGDRLLEPAGILVVDPEIGHGQLVYPGAGLGGAWPLCSLEQHLSNSGTDLSSRFIDQ